MTDDRLLWLARMIGLSGLGLLVFSGIGGVLLASRTAQKMKLFKGQTFKWHRLFSLIGAALFLLHPIPILLAKHTTGGLNLLHVFVPFTAPKQSLWIGLGVIAAYLLLVVTISSLYIKKMKRGTWRVLHYGTYLVLLLGLVHGLFISAEFRKGEGLFSGEKKQERPAMSEEQKKEQIGAKKDEGEIIDFEEPEKIILLVLAGITVLFPIWRIIAARKNRGAKRGAALSLLLLFLLAPPPARAQGGQDAQNPAQEPPQTQAPQDRNKPASIQRTEPPTKAPPRLTGNLLFTGNVSTLDRPLPSLNERLTLDYALPRGQILDLRVENYYEGSYNQNPPGVLGRNINEEKLEIQGTYTYPLTSVFSLSGAILHHENFTFRDNYEWAITTLTAKIPLSKRLTLTPNVSLEKRFQGGRFFYDTATTLDYAFAKGWTFETTYHRYENYGELDPAPSQKQEVEIGGIYQLTPTQTLGLSFFRHIQFGSPNDQFSFIKLKYGISF